MKKLTYFLLVCVVFTQLHGQNKTKMSDWEDSIKKKNDFKIKTIKVTTDYMNFWELDKKDMAKVYSRKTKLKNKNK